jgi:hypothetical protein
MDQTKEDGQQDLEWSGVEEMFRERFGKTPDLEAVLFLIGIQELGQSKRTFTKEQKQDLMHIAVCTLLAPSGYYKLEKYDEDGWPHFTEVNKVSGMDLKEQEAFLKRHVIAYFKENGYLKDLDRHHPNR